VFYPSSQNTTGLPVGIHLSMLLEAISKKGFWFNTFEKDPKEVIHEIKFFFQTFEVSLFRVFVMKFASADQPDLGHKLKAVEEIVNLNLSRFRGV